MPDDGETPKDSGSEGRESAEAEPSGQLSAGLVDTFARGLGQLTRTVSDQLGSIAYVFAPQRPARVRREQVPEESVAVLLERLGRLVTAHEQQSYVSLEHESEFWELITRLFRARRRRPVKRVVVRRSPATEAEVQDATLEDGGEAPATAQKAAEKGGDASAEKPGNESRES